MGKRKYIKNSKGVTMSVTTDTLGLEKPLLNENYDIDVHNRNMDKIDEDLKPIDDSYIIELFQHDGDTTNPRDYYTKLEADEKFASKEEAKNALNKANEALQAGDNVKSQLVDKLISEGLDVSTNNTFEELISGIALGKKWASGVSPCSELSDTVSFTKAAGSGTTSWNYFDVKLDFPPSVVLGIHVGSDGVSMTTVFSTFHPKYGACVSVGYGASEYSTSRKGQALFVNERVVLGSNLYRLPTGYSANNVTWMAFE